MQVEELTIFSSVFSADRSDSLNLQTGHFRAWGLFKVRGHFFKLTSHLSRTGLRSFLPLSLNKHVRESFSLKLKRMWFSNSFFCQLFVGSIEELHLLSPFLLLFTCESHEEHLLITCRSYFTPK